MAKLTDSPVDPPALDLTNISSLLSGIPSPQMPTNRRGDLLRPEIPTDLSTATNARLGRLMGELVSCANYCAYIAALDDVQFVLAENQLEYVTAQMRLRKSGNTTMRRDLAKVDPTVKKANKDFLIAMAKSKLTAALLENYERQIRVISREISRRSSETSRTISPRDETP